MSRRKPKYTELTAQVAAIKAIREDMKRLYDEVACHDGGRSISTTVLDLIIKRIDAALKG